MRILRLFLFSFLITSISACSILKNKKILKEGTFQQDSFITELPFRLISNLIVFEVSIDGNLYNFIFDTGAEVSLISPELVSELNLKRESSISVKGSNNNSKRINLYFLDDIMMNDVGFEKLLCAESDLNAQLADFEEFGCGTRIDGLIGNNLMKKATWKIDYQNNTITFWDVSRTVIPSSKHDTIPIEFTELGNPNIEVRMNDYEGEFLFDTGFGGLMEANMSVLKKTGVKSEAGKSATGVGLSVSIHSIQTVEEVKQKIPEVVMGDRLVRDMIVSFEENGSNLIGNRFWKNHIVTIDWKKSMLFIEDIKESHKKSLQDFQYGIMANIREKTLSIKSYWTSHSSYEPIDSENEVVAIEHYQIADIVDFCDFLKTELPDLLQSNTLQMVVIENGKKRIVQMKKEVLIE